MEDSSYNEVERTNAAVGNTLVDGGGIKWDHHSPFEGLSEEEIQQLSLDEGRVLNKNGECNGVKRIQGCH